MVNSVIVLAIFMVVIIVIVIIFSKRKCISGFSNTDKTRDMSDITDIVEDQCVNHYERVLPLDSKRCHIKFKTEKTQNKKNVERHNNKEICLSACTYHYSQRIDILYKMVKFAVNFFSKYSVEWCLYYGGLVGIHTRKELLPWDPDVDFIIKVQDIDKLPTNYKDDFYLFKIHQPKGDEDIVGRIIDKQSGLYADITYYTADQNTVYVKKMPTPKNPNRFLSIPKYKFYPIVQMSFKNGITVPVPYDIQYNLEQRYGKIKDGFKFVNGKYIKNV